MKKLFSLIAAVTVGGLSMTAAAQTYEPHIRMGAAEVNDKIIFDAPKGELSWLDRSCDGFVTKAFDATHGPILGSVVQMVEGDDGYVYLSHMASEYPVDTWTRFEREGDTLVMEGVQAIYKEYDDYYDLNFTVYLAPMKVVINENNVGTFVVTDDCRFVLNIGEDGTLTSADPEMLLGVCVHTLDENLEGNDVWIWKGFGDRDIKMTKASGVPVSLPAGLGIENWVMFDGFDSVFVQVAIDGDDFYVNGVDRSLPDAWIKGKIADGKVTFPSGQYLGADMEIFYYSYFCGADFYDVTDEDGNAVRVAGYADSAIFTYDAEAGSLTMERGYIINSTPEELFPLYFYDEVWIGLQHRDPDAAPDTPYALEYFMSDWGDSVWFLLPNVDVDGNILMVENLFYEIYVDDELQYFDIEDKNGIIMNTPRIPYEYDDFMDFWVAGQDHTVYLYVPVEHSIEIRSVYVNENGEEVFSELGYWEQAGTEGTDAMKTKVSERWYDLQGRQVSERHTGAAVKVTSYSDGTVASSKVITRK